MSEPTKRVSLVVRKTIQASPARLFEAWTTASQLLRWWGPKGVECTDAQLDLTVGGHYTLANRLPDGSVILIRGEFVEITPPHKLVYTWSTDPEDATKAKDDIEQVTVRFEPRGAATEVIVVHERIAPPRREGHETGWAGCLDGLATLVETG